MEDDLAEAMSFASPFEAELARNHLEEEGIRAFIMDSEVAAMAWHLTLAIGGVKLYVARRDLVRAQTILDELARDPLQVEEESENDEAYPEGAIREGLPGSIREGTPPAFDDGEGEPEEPPTEREHDARRALHGAVAGLIVLPLQLYVLLMIFAVLGSDERLRPEYRRKLQWAMAINFPLMLIGGVVLAQAARALFFDR